MLGIESISGTPFLVGTDVFKGSDTLPSIHLIFLETLNLLYLTWTVYVPGLTLGFKMINPSEQVFLINDLFPITILMFLWEINFFDPFK